MLVKIETSYEPVAEAAGSSSVAPPAEASTVTAKPPSPVSSAAQVKASVAKGFECWRCASGATPAGTAAPVAASPAGPPVPTPRAGQPVAPPVERTTPVFRGRRYESGSRKLSRASRPRFEAAPRTAATTALGSLRPWTRSTTRASSCSWQALPSVLTALSSSCSEETRSVGQARTRRCPSQWTTMTRVAAPAKIYPFGSWICYF